MNGDEQKGNGTVTERERNGNGAGTVQERKNYCTQNAKFPQGLFFINFIQRYINNR